MHIGSRSPPRIRSTAGSHDGLRGELVIDAMLVIEVPSLRSPSAHRIGDPAKWDTIPEPLLDPLARGRLNTRPSGILARLRQDGQVAQLVEQRTENPRVGGSIPPLATIQSAPIKMRQFIFTHTSGPVPRHAVLGVGGCPITRGRGSARGLVQCRRGRTAEQREPVVDPLSGQALVSAGPLVPSPAPRAQIEPGAEQVEKALSGALVDVEIGA